VIRATVGLVSTATPSNRPHFQYLSNKASSPVVSPAVSAPTPSPSRLSLPPRSANARSSLPPLLIVPSVTCVAAPDTTALDATPRELQLVALATIPPTVPEPVPPVNVVTTIAITADAPAPSPSCSSLQRSCTA